MKKLRKIAGGDTYTIIYLKLQLLSLQNNGDLHFEGVEENLLEELALDIDESVENVQATMFFLEKCGLVTDLSTDKVSLPEVKENTGTETSSAERVRKHREKKKQLSIGVNEGQKVLQCNNEVTKCNTEIEKEKETEKELKKEKKKEKNNAVASCPLLNIPEVKSAWDEWMKVRASKKASNSQQAISRAVNSLVKFSDNKKDVAIQILNNSSDGGWTKLYELKPKYSQQSIFKNKPQLGVNKLTQEERDELKF